MSRLFSFQLAKPLIFVYAIDLPTLMTLECANEFFFPHLHIFCIVRFLVHYTPVDYHRHKNTIVRVWLKFKWRFNLPFHFLLLLLFLIPVTCYFWFYKNERKFKECKKFWWRWWICDSSWIIFFKQHQMSFFYRIGIVAVLHLYELFQIRFSCRCWPLSCTRNFLNISFKNFRFWNPKICINFQLPAIIQFINSD